LPIETVGVSSPEPEIEVEFPTAVVEASSGESDEVATEDVSVAVKEGVAPPMVPKGDDELSKPVVAVPIAEPLLETAEIMLVGTPLTP